MTDYERFKELLGDKAAPASEGAMAYYQKTDDVGYILCLETPYGYSGFDAELWFDKDGKYMGAAAWE